MTKPERIARLLYKSGKKSLTATEKLELQQWASEATENQQLLQRMQDQQFIEQAVADYYRLRREAAAQRKQPARRTAPNTKKALIGISMAAVLIMAVFAGWLGWFSGARRQPQGKPQDRAVAQAPPAWRQITAGQGQQYKAVLPDGTGVWLNAASQLQYPAAFTGGERRVWLTGEAYFEVAKHDGKPFIVQAENGSDTTSVEVLGTHFNVKAWKRRPVQTTVLEGKVRISNRYSADTLQQGQQAWVDSTGRMVIEAKADTNKAMAWKNNTFHFGKTALPDIMEELARWYNVEVEYRYTTSEQFHGELERDKKLDTVLKILEATGYVAFERKGNKVLVKAPRKK